MRCNDRCSRRISRPATVWRDDMTPDSSLGPASIAAARSSSHSRGTVACVFTAVDKLSNASAVSRSTRAVRRAAIGSSSCSRALATPTAMSAARRSYSWLDASRSASGTRRRSPMVVSVSNSDSVGNGSVNFNARPRAYAARSRYAEASACRSGWFFDHGGRSAVIAWIRPPVTAAIAAIMPLE